jgi:hypothetical protein
VSPLFAGWAGNGAGTNRGATERAIAASMVRAAVRRIRSGVMKAAVGLTTAA